MAERTEATEQQKGTRACTPSKTTDALLRATTPKQTKRTLEQTTPSPPKEQNKKPNIDPKAMSDISTVQLQVSETSNQKNKRKNSDVKGHPSLSPKSS